MALTDGATGNARSGLAASPALPGGPAAAIADLMGHLAADHGRLLQCGELLPPILPVNVRSGHLRPLRHRCRRDVAGLPLSR